MALPAAARDLMLEPVRIATSINLSDLPTLVAEERGLFAQHGLDAEISVDDSGERKLERLRDGQVDFALMTLTPLVIDHLFDSSPGGPEDPVILAGLIHSTNINQVVFLRERAIDEPSDLHGRQVALPTSTNAEFLWWLFSTLQELSPDIRLLRQYSDTEVQALLTDGAIDAAVIQEPWITKLRARLGDDLGQFPVSPFYSAKWVLVTSRRTALEDRERCAAMLATYRDAIELLSQQERDLLALYAEHFGLPLAALDQDWQRQSLDYDLGIDWSLIAALQQQAYWATAYHQRVSSSIIDVIALIDDSILRALRPGAVSIPPPAPQSP
ncbi:ABC transporter substrate-binding protein [Halochromatium sp.]